MSSVLDAQFQRWDHDRWLAGAVVVEGLVKSSDLDWRRKRRRPLLLEKAGFRKYVHLVRNSKIPWIRRGPPRIDDGVVKVGLLGNVFRKVSSERFRHKLIDPKFPGRAPGEHSAKFGIGKVKYKVVGTGDPVVTRELIGLRADSHAFLILGKPETRCSVAGYTQSMTQFR